jgi:pilus assembly protein CpaE
MTTMKKPALSIVEPAGPRTGGAAGLRIGVVAPDRESQDAIRAALDGTEGIAALFPAGASLQGLAPFAADAVPELLIVQGGCGPGELALLERLGQTHPTLAFILVCKEQAPEFLLQAMRAGVREVLPSPLAADALREAVDRVRRKLGMGAARKGKIIAFISCKGGSGATFLAANLAYALAEEGRQKVALFDFNLQFGDALMFLTDQTAPTNLAHVAQDIHRLDAAFLASSMVSLSPNLSVLASPNDPAQGMEVTPEHIDAVLQLARAQYDLILLDVGRTLDAQTIKALDHADTIFAVLQSTLPFIRDGRRLLDVFRTLDYPKSKVGLVVNRFEKGGDIGIAELERALGASVLRTIPNHYQAAAASVNQGIPIARLAKNNPVTRALIEWSEELAGPREQEARHWIARMFKRA